MSDLQRLRAPEHPGGRVWTVLMMLLVLPALAAACSGARGTDALDRLERCMDGRGPVDSYCGTLEVWEDRDARSGRRLALNIVVLPGLRKDAAPDPMFFLAGGPGQGAAQMARQIQAAFETVLVDRDIVLVDQRGTGDSNSLGCEFDEEPLDADVDASLRLLRECLERYDADPSLYTTPIAMDDLDEVREFLGYDRINLYGGSYGTRAAIVYVRRHGDRVRSVVLDGVAPTNMGLPLYMARDGQRAFELLAADCEADAACSAAFPDLEERFQRLLGRLDADPERVTVVHPRTGEREEVNINRLLVAGIVFSALYSPETAAMIPFLIDRAESGEYGGLIALGSLNEGAADQISLGMRYSVVCAEDAPRIDPEILTRETEGTFMGRTTADLFLKTCEFWPRGEVPDDYYDPLPSDVPALILSGEFDPVTPPVWGAAIAEQWTHARHLVVPGIGHGAAMRGCTMRLVRQFLDEATAENLDPGCLEELHRRPFFLGYAGPAAAGMDVVRAPGSEPVAP